MKVGCYFFFLLIKEILSQTQELDKIIQEAIKNNPKTEPDLLPVLPKMLTKTGLLCTFPFYFDDKIFFEKCVQIKGGKFICKVNVDPNTLEKEILNKLLNIKDTYFDECLSLDETEKYLNDLVDKNFDFKKKLLIDLYADIKKTISVTRNSKLIILYELAENYCKNKSFDYECLYKWIIKPISKTSTLQSTSNLILATMDKYKTILDQFVKQSINLKFKEREFKYIKKQNLFFTENIEKKTIIDEGGSKSISRELILLDDNKLDLPNFFKILTLVGGECIEECKVALEYILADNFGDFINRMMEETVAYLFNIEQIDNIDSQINFNSTHLNYHGKVFEKNIQSKLFTNYKKWHLRYFLFIIYRYLLLERPFYNEIIVGKFTEDQLFNNLFLPHVNQINDQQLLKVSRFIPITNPYLSFANQIHNLIIKIYKEWNKISIDVKNNLQKDLELREKMYKFINEMKVKLEDKKKFLEKIIFPLINDTIKIKANASDLKESLNMMDNGNSTFPSVKLESYINNLNYVNNLIYSSKYFSQDCHKFLHFNTYYDNITLGRPQTGYIFMGFDTDFFHKFDNDTQLYYIYGFINFVKYKGRIYFIKITSNSRIELFLNDEKLKPFKRKNAIQSFFYKKAEKSYYMIESPKMKKSYINLKIKGEFKRGVYDVTDKKMIQFFLKDKMDDKVPPLKKNEIQKKIDEYNKKNIKNDFLNFTKKCSGEIISEQICFDYHSFKVNCDYSCKLISEKFNSNIQEKENVKVSSNEYTMSFSEKLKKKKKNRIFSNDEDKNLLSNCINYCIGNEWTLPIYKCVYRNIISDRFDTLLTKCNALNEWKLIARNHQNDTWFKGTKIIKLKEEYLDVNEDNTEKEDKRSNSLIKYIEYAFASVYSPIGDFNLAISLVLEEYDEFMFASGDFKFWAVLDKFQLSKKGAPFTAFTKKNSKMYNYIKAKDSEMFNLAVYNRFFSSDNPEEPLIFLNNYHKMKNTDKLLFAQNSFKGNTFLLGRDGVNVYVKKKTICLNQFFFVSNYPSGQYYVEKAPLTKMSFLFTDASRLIYKVPQSLDSKAIFLRTNSFQKKYSLSIFKKAKVFIALEINDDTEVNGSKLIQEGWIFMDGNENILEIVNADIGDHVKELSEFSFYNCVFQQKDIPVCEKKVVDNLNILKMNIFYKEILNETIKIEFDFFEFDNLNSALHLIFLQPLECRAEDNLLHSFNDEVNNLNSQIIYALPSYNVKKKKDFVKTNKKNVIKKTDIDKKSVKKNQDTKKPDIIKDIVSKIQNKNADVKLKKSTSQIKFLEVNKINHNKETDKFEENNAIGTNMTFIEKPKNKKKKKKNKSKITGSIDNLSSKKKEINNLKKDINGKNKTSKGIIKEKKLYDSIQFTSPKIRVNQNGCVLSLDRFGNLFFISFENLKKNSFTSISKIETNLIE